VYKFLSYRLFKNYIERICPESNPWVRRLYHKYTRNDWHEINKPIWKRASVEYLGSVNEHLAKMDGALLSRHRSSLLPRNSSTHHARDEAPLAVPVWDCWPTVRTAQLGISDNVYQSLQRLSGFTKLCVRYSEKAAFCHKVTGIWRRHSRRWDGGFVTGLLTRYRSISISSKLMHLWEQPITPYQIRSASV